MKKKKKKLWSQDPSSVGRCIAVDYRQRVTVFYGWNAAWQGLRSAVVSPLHLFIILRIRSSFHLLAFLLVPTSYGAAKRFRRDVRYNTTLPRPQNNICRFFFFISYIKQKMIGSQLTIRLTILVFSLNELPIRIIFGKRRKKAVSPMI